MVSRGGEEWRWKNSLVFYGEHREGVCLFGFCYSMLDDDDDDDDQPTFCGEGSCFENRVAIVRL